MYAGESAGNGITGETDDMNRNQIKTIAIIAMMIDHIAMFFLAPGIAEAPLSRVAVYAAMRVIGRLTAPIMLFFLVEGFTYTSSRFKYGLRLLIFGLISQIPYALSHYNSLWKLDFNVIITLFLTFLMLVANEKIENRLFRRIVVFGLIMVTFCCDWGVIGPFMAWLFYENRGDRKAQIRYYSLISAIQVISAAYFLFQNGYHWYGELWQTGLFLVIPFLLHYNGEAGRKSELSKWIFYLVYPVHLLFFWLVKFVV